MFSFQHLCQGATASLFSFITYRHRLDPVSTTQYIQTHPPARCGGCRFLKSQFFPWFLLCSFAICLRALFSVLTFILFAFNFESDTMKPLLTTHVSITTPSSTFSLLRLRPDLGRVEPSSTLPASTLSSFINCLFSSLQLTNIQVAHHMDASCMYRNPPEITSDSSRFAESAQTMWAFEHWRPLAQLRRTANKTATFWTKIIGVNALRTSDSTWFFLPSVYALVKACVRLFSM